MSKGVPLFGDRSAYDNKGYPTRHAKDVTDGTPTQHNPTGASEGDAPVWDGEKWVPVEVSPADHNHDGTYAPVVHDHDDRYYTETELETSGQAEVHWDNITNAPEAYPPDAHTHTESEITDLDHDAQKIKSFPVDAPLEADDGKAIVYDFANAKWKLATAGGASALDDLTDVNAPAPADGDVLTWDDAAGEWVAEAGGGGTTDANAIHDNVDGEINAITLKATPADDDILVIEDSAASYAKKKITLSSLAALLSVGAFLVISSIPGGFTDLSLPLTISNVPVP